MNNEWGHGGSIDWRMPKEPPSYGMMWIWPWPAAALLVLALSIW